MKIDPNKIYHMPLIAGPYFDKDDRPGNVYQEVDVLMLQFQTDPDPVRNLVPECYEIDEKPNIYITFQDYGGVDFMAGGGYRIATFGVSASFDGEEDHIEGQHIFVVLEDRTLPIIGGREQLGVPKIFADISPVRALPEGRLRCNASLWGHLLFGIDLEQLKEQNALMRAAAARQINKNPWLCYKYIPSFDGPPDADYPTIVWFDFKVEHLWLGKEGKAFFGDAGEEDIGYYSKLITAMKSLPLLELISVARMRGSIVLRNDKCRRLK